MNERGLRLAAIASALIILAFAGESFAQGGTKTISLGTATQTGNFYPTGAYLCELVNKGRDKGEHNVHCSVQATGGAVVNLRAIRRGEMALGFAVSEVQADAYNGTGAFKDEGPNKDLRFVMSLYPEPFHLIVRKDAGVKHFRDIRGKRVASGQPGTSTRETAHVMMTYFGIDSKKDIIDVPLTFRETPAALCDNKIDVIIFASGVPTPLAQEAINTCDAKLAPIDGPEINKLLSEHAYFAPLTIPGGSYPGNDVNVNTFGSSATVVSSQSVDADTVYHVVKALFDNFEAFKQQKPFYKLMTRESSANVSRVGVPYHDGAKRFYEQHGLIK
jgi:hypothetical protein